MTRIPSSREMIAAGTSPPRVMHTIARHWPLVPASRHASARASRWNWSQETGKAFSGRDIFRALQEARMPRTRKQGNARGTSRKTGVLARAGNRELLTRQEGGDLAGAQYRMRHPAEQEPTQP